MKICRRVLTPSTKLQNRSFHVVERTRAAAKCTKIKSTRAKRVLESLLNMQICDVVVNFVIVAA